VITLLLASGKGGTGKTTITAMLAAALSKYYEFKVALLDLDTCGPNLPKVLETLTGRTLWGQVFDEEGFYPMTDGMFEVFSPAFLMPEGVGVAWDGRKRQDLIRELLLEVRWNKPDILLCDCPPGTGDEIIAVMTYADHIDGVIAVTTGARASVDDAKRLIAMMRSERFNAPVLGVVENMGYLYGGEGGSVRFRMFSDKIDYATELDAPILAVIPFSNHIDVEQYRGLAEAVIRSLGLRPPQEIPPADPVTCAPNGEGGGSHD